MADQVDHGHVDHVLVVVGAGLVVAYESVVGCQPDEGPFDNPAAVQDLEPCGVLGTVKPRVVWRLVYLDVVVAVCGCSLRWRSAPTGRRSATRGRRGWTGP